MATYDLDGGSSRRSVCAGYDPRVRHVRPNNGLSRSNFAVRGNAVYKEKVQPKLTEADQGKIVALDVESGTYEIDDDKLAAIRRLRDRRPGAIAWLVRVGSPYVDRLGARRSTTKPDC
jgi:hypothetical protein